MKIKLCYKEYDFKLTLEACKNFYDATGEDLQYTLLKYTEACRHISVKDVLGSMVVLLKVCKFEVAAQAIHALVKTKNKNIPLDEIRDAMFRVSWLPNDREDDISDPWPVVMTVIARDINKYFNESIPVKKKATKAKKRKQ